MVESGCWGLDIVYLYTRTYMYNTIANAHIDTIEKHKTKYKSTHKGGMLEG